MAANKPEIGEFELIDRYFSALAASEDGALGLQDDCAILGLPDTEDLVVTTDTLVAGVHFLPETPADAIAAKLLRVNLSDLASMGAGGRAYTLSLALNENATDAWLRAFASSLQRDQETYGIVLVGGDTVSTPGSETFTVTAFGSVPKGQGLRRGGARPGDQIYVSGTLGDAALGLLALQGKVSDVSRASREFLINRHQYPQPRLELGQNLLGVATSAVDVSDGLAADLAHICAVSRVGAEIKWDQVPLSNAAREVLDQQPELMSEVLGGGDDYELVFTVPTAEAGEIEGLSGKLGLELTKIGRISDDTEHKVLVCGSDGAPVQISDAGYRHF